MDLTRVIVVVLIVIGLGLAGALLRLQSQRKQSEARQRMNLERAELQRSADKLQQDVDDLRKPSKRPSDTQQRN
jgi:type II secretory pathway pseudopilin PulG